MLLHTSWPLSPCAAFRCGQAVVNTQDEASCFVKMLSTNQMDKSQRGWHEIETQALELHL